MMIIDEYDHKDLPLHAEGRDPAKVSTDTRPEYRLTAPRLAVRGAISSVFTLSRPAGAWPTSRRAVASRVRDGTARERARAAAVRSA
jgi:hypothetical protein